jgi:hypothetical protein
MRRPAAKLAGEHLQEPFTELAQAQLSKNISSCFSAVADAVKEPLGEVLCQQTDKPSNHADAKREKLLHLSSFCSDCISD